MPCCRALFVTAAVFALPAVALAQEGQRRLSSPGLVLNTPGRTAACDALLFTRDGKELLAAGDDKVVRAWPFAYGKLNAAAARVLRWRAFREKLGSIYALALSPDEKLVAVAGHGVRPGEVTVLERLTGQVIHTLDSDPSAKDEIDSTVRSLAFTPDGKRLVIGNDDGGLLLWTLGQKYAGRIGRHQRRFEQDRFPAVRLIHFLDRDGKAFVSVTADGVLAHWKTEAGQQKPLFAGLVLHPKDGFPVRIRTAAAAPDGTRIAIGVAGTYEPPLLSLHDLKGKRLRSFNVAGKDDVPFHVTFSRDGRYLAAGTFTSPREAFYRPTGAAVCVYDLGVDGRDPAVVLDTDPIPEALAFHPDGNSLVVAGGADNQVTVWQWRKKKQTDRLSGPGHALWDVALNEDGQKLGFKPTRNLKATHPNDRASGKWVVFDLEQRSPPRIDNDFEPVPKLSRTNDGWSVRLVGGKFWKVVDPAKKEYDLPVGESEDFLECYTFLEPEEQGKPVRLAVGHYSGWTLYELTAGAAPRRVRRTRGHVSQVVALAPSKDQRSLVTASRDQTVAAWSLLPWKHQRELGASFETREGGLFVTAVEAGSPAWEAGLEAGQQIERLLAAGAEVFPREGAGAAIKRLAAAEPGVQLAFDVRGRGRLTTSCWQRPIWQFFPARQGPDRWSWVMWRRTRDFYYDHGGGDGLIGLHTNSLDLKATPQLVPARTLPNYHQPNKIGRTVGDLSDRAEAVRLPELVPPVAAVAVDRGLIEGKGTATATVRLEVPIDAIAARPSRVELWLNDRRFKALEAARVPFTEKVALDSADLRAGRNRVRLLAVDENGNRTVTPPAEILLEAKRARTLHALVIGIDDYSASKVPADKNNKGGKLPSLKHAAADAGAMKAALEGLKGKLCEKAEVEALSGGAATREAILARLAAVKQKARPDDLFVLYFAGHSHSKPKGGSAWEPGSACLALAGYDADKPDAAGVRLRTLAGLLAETPCRKVVLLDARSNGGADLRQELTGDGVGPSVLTGTSRGEKGQEHAKIGGAFTHALIEALAKLAGEPASKEEGFPPIAELHDQVVTGLGELRDKHELPEQTPEAR